MAVMQALLQVKADVTGEGQVNALGRAIGGIKQKATEASVGLRGLTAAAGMGGLAGSFSMLAPLLSVGGLVAMTKKTMDAGSEMYLLAQKTGVSVEALAQFKKAATSTGTPIDTVAKALAKLSRAMVTSSSEVQDGEKDQTRIVKEEANKRVEALEKETDERLREISKRYREEEKLLSDKYDDEDAAQSDVDERQLKELERQLERQYNARRRAIENDQTLSDDARDSALENLRYQEEDAQDSLRDSFEQQKVLRSRALRDQREQERDAIEERKRNEEAVLKQSLETQKDAIKSAIANYDQFGNSLDELGINGKGASKAFSELGISLKNQNGSMKSANVVMREIATRFKNMEDGPRKTALAMEIFGKSGMELIPMLNMGGDAIDKMSVKMTTAFAQKAHEYSAKIAMLGGKVGALGADIAIVLLPVLDKMADGITAVVDWFNKLDPGIRNTIVAVSLFAISFGAIATVIGTVVGALGTIGGAVAGLGAAFAGTSIAATIAGWLPAIIGATSGIVAALGGILTFVTGTLIPGLLAVVTGPVGLTVLLVAAIVALFIAFREPIMGFLTWVWENLVGGFQKIADWYMNVYVKFWVDLWANYIVKPITDFLAWFGKVFMKGWETYVNSIRTVWDAAAGFFTQAWQKAGSFITGIWNGIINGLRGIVNGFFSAFFGQINSAIRAINSLIAGFNQLPGPDIPFIPQVPIPRFAEGGVVDRPTLAMVGEGGEREYIIPESKMAGAAAAYLGGARGASVVGPSTINVTTGPVLQQQGQNWVTMADLQQAMRATEAATLQRIRTPAGRAALGIR